MPVPNIVTENRIIEDASAGLWLIAPDGRMAEIQSEHVAAGAEVIRALPLDMDTSYFAKPGREPLAPFDEFALATCPECKGKGYVDCLVIREGEGTVGRFDGDDLDDVRELRDGRTVGMGEWDCPNETCVGGVAIVPTGRQLTLADLPRVRKAEAA
jgi:hypothetical protein